MRMNCLVVAAEGGVGPRYGEVLVLAPAQPALASQLELVKINPNLKRVYNIIRYSVFFRPPEPDTQILFAELGMCHFFRITALSESCLALVIYPPPPPPLNTRTGEGVSVLGQSSLLSSTWWKRVSG